MRAANSTDADIRCRGCGHYGEAHEHFRRGTDCSAARCRCLRFRLPWRVLALRLRARLIGR